MNRHVLPILVLTIAGWSSSRGEQVLVTGVSGQVLYAPADTLPGLPGVKLLPGMTPLPILPVHAGQKLGGGIFSCANDAILYLSAFDGSELRLSESGTLRYDGINGVCYMEKGNGVRSTFHLIKGQVAVNIKVPSTPPHCYHVILPQAEMSMSHGQCVMCMHGGGAFLYVSRGDLAVTNFKPREEPLVNEQAPIYGAVPVAQQNTLTPIQADHTQVLVGNGKVGVVGVNGDIQVVPLSELGAASQSCLLAGFNPDVVEGGSSKKGVSPDSAVVSPTQ